MIDNTLIQTAFAPLIGFRRGLDSSDEVLDSDLTSSSTGTFVDGLHPLLTTRNLTATWEDSSSFTVAPYYKPEVTYAKGDIIELSDKVYYSLIANNQNQDPETQTDAWVETTLFSHYLRSKRNDSIINLLNAVRGNAKILGGKEVLQNLVLFYGPGLSASTKNDRFVGLTLTLQKQDLTVKVPRIILEFTKAQTIPIYLYHSSSSTAVATYNLVYTNAGRAQSFLLPTELLLRFENNNIGGYYTIGYYESDLDEDNEALFAHNLPFGGTTCTTCNSRSAAEYAKYSPYVDIQPIQVDSDFLNKPSQSWTENDMVVVTGTNWGLNMVFNVVCDLTDTYIYNKDLFTAALGAQIKLDLLTVIAHNGRNNQGADSARNKAFAELKAEQNPYKELQKAINTLSLDMSNLNPTCIPCEDKKTAINWGSIWRK